MDNKKNKDDLFRFVEYSPEAAERTGYSDSVSYTHLTLPTIA